MPCAQRGNSSSRCATVAIVWAFADDEPSLPGHQRRHRPRARGAAQLVAIQLGDDLHDAPINRVALTGQLRQLLEQHLKTLVRTHHQRRQSDAVEDITPSSQPGPTNLGRPIRAGMWPSSDAKR